MIQKKPLAVAVAATFAISGFVFAQTAQPQAPQKIEKIEVTGSNIKRVDTETVSPVQIISRQDIERSGRSTVADVLRDLPINSSQSFNETWTSGFGTGGSGISLRGLGQLGTLTLINGRRVANYAFAQNVTDSFVDLNQLPSSAVERIEILKDGASAIYGSDAIAGVVNIILRKDFKGVEVSASGGSELSGGTRNVSASITGGIGDLSKDRYNAFAIFDFYDRKGSLRSDYELTRTNDYTRFFAGDDRRGSTGGTWRAASGPAALRLVRVPVNPCPTELIPSSRLNATLRGTSCAGDVGPSVTTLIPDQTRLSAQAKGTFRINNDVEAYGEASFSRVTTKFLGDYNYLTAGATRFAPTKVGNETFLIPQSVRYLIAPTAPGNPFNGTTVFNGETLGAALAEFLVPTYELGVQNTKAVTDSGSALLGFRGTSWNWDWDSGLSYGQSKGSSTVSNLISYSGLLRTGTLNATKPASVVVNGAIVASGGFNPTTTNSADIVNAMRTSTTRNSTSTFTGVDVKASRELGTLGAGPLAMAVGAEFRRESLKDVPDAALLAGDVLNRGATGTDGSRNVSAAFIEVTASPIRNLETQVAARLDNYSDAGSAVSPKLGLKYKVTAELLGRVNWGKGFRAPSLPQISRSDTTAFQSLFDYAGCLGANYAPSCQGLSTGTGTSTGVILRSNPDLQPEKSESLTAGLVWSPTNETSMSFDYYDIKWRNIISNSDLDGALLLEYYRDVEKQPGVVVPSEVQIFRDPTNGGLLGVVSRFINVSRVQTKGMDFDIRHRFNSPYGRFSVGADVSYVDSFKQTEPGIDDSSGKPVSVQVTSNFAGRNTSNQSAFPRLRGSSRLDWEYQGVNLGLKWNYIHSYRQAALLQAGKPIVNFRGEARPEMIPSYSTYDLNFGYRFTRDLRMTGFVRNVFNRYPPFDPRMINFAFAIDQYSPVSRFASIGVNYSYR